MDTLVSQKTYSFEEYWELEQHSQTRHEFINGQIIAMPIVTQKHNIICGNLFADFKALLKGSAYLAFIESVKLQIESKRDYTYPDICIAAKEGNNNSDLWIKNPILIVEVLSEGTKLYDKVDKFMRYKQLDSLQYYVLVDTDKVLIDVYSKDPKTNEWESESYTQLSESINFAALSLQIQLQSVYEGVIA